MNKKLMINITMTALCRPQILERTLKSFCEGFFFMPIPTGTEGSSLIPGDMVKLGQREIVAEIAYKTDEALYVIPPGVAYNFIVNIDPVGQKGKPDIDLTKDVIKTYFPKADIHTPDDPGFGKAFKHVWMKSATIPAHYTFHLEDDWELQKPYPITNLVKMFNKYHPHLTILRLSSFKGTHYHSKQWNHFIPWNGVFYQVASFQNGSLGFAGHPSLIRQDFINMVAPLLDPKKNPEKQIKGNNKDMKEIGVFDHTRIYGVVGLPNEGPLVKDIGGSWREKSVWKKAGSKSYFTEYEKKKK